jgi:hypothetical protein
VLLRLPGRRRDVRREGPTGPGGGSGRDACGGGGETTLVYGGDHGQRRREARQRGEAQRSGTRSCSTPKPRRSRRRVSPASPSSKTAPEFPRKLPADWSATRAGSRSFTTWWAQPTAQCSTWVGRPARSPRPLAERSMPETAAAASQGVGSASRTPTTLCTGRMAEIPSSPTPYCCVAAIIGASTRAATRSVAIGTGRSCSSHLRGTHCSRYHRCRSYRRIRSRRWCVAIANGASCPVFRVERQCGRGTATFRGRSRQRPSGRSIRGTSRRSTRRVSALRSSASRPSTGPPAVTLRPTQGLPLQFPRKSRQFLRLADATS